MQQSYIGQACEELIARGFVDAAVLRALEQVGFGASVDRVYVHERVVDDARRVRKLCAQRYAWTSTRLGVESTGTEFESLDVASVAPGWQSAFARDEHVVGVVAAMPGPLRSLLAARQVQSIFACPIFVGRDWWGFVGCDDCHAERTWPDDEVRGLRRLATALATSVRRAQTHACLELARQQLVAVAGDDGRRSPPIVSASRAGPSRRSSR